VKQNSKPDINNMKESMAKKRPTLLQLMGYPEEVGDNDYECEEIKPKWNAVLNHLESNPEEVSTPEDEDYPLDDALWIKSKPVPVEVIIKMLRLCPEGFTSKSYEIACENPDTSPEVMRVLRAADLTGDIVKERSPLVKLMGYPPYMFDNDYDQEDVKPDWDAVRERLITNPEEAQINEDDTFPLADALWIESSPVPIDIVETLIQIHPEGLTDESFINASHKKTRSGVLRLMFSHDRKKSHRIN
jgi:hypothetical protein